MPRPSDLPSALASRPFTTTDAQRQGVTMERLRASDLQRPFHGVRSIDLELSVVEQKCLAYSARMLDREAFSHSTAALLWGMPLPLAVTNANPLHVTVAAPARAVRVKGVVGHQRHYQLHVLEHNHYKVVTAAEAWCDLAEQLALHDIVAAGDYAVTGSPYNNILPLTTVEELARAAARRGRGPGSRARRAALDSIEEGPLSRPESLVRLLLLTAGVPHPVINQEVTDARGSSVATPDLAWPEFRVALEYEGDHHRAVKQFRHDIQRIERIVDQGWLVVKVSADDLFDRPRDLVARVVRRLESRGWSAGAIRLPQNGVYSR
jgi:hypothetical protein